MKTVAIAVDGSPALHQSLARRLIPNAVLGLATRLIGWKDVALTSVEQIVRRLTP